MAEESNHHDYLRRILVQVGIALKPICQKVHLIRDDFDCSDALQRVKQDLMECAKHMGQPEHEVHSLFSSVDFLNTAHKKLTQEDAGLHSKYLDAVFQVAEGLVAKCGDRGQEPAMKLKQLKEGFKEGRKKSSKTKKKTPEEETGAASKTLTTPEAAGKSPSSRPTTAGEGGGTGDPKQILIREKFPWVNKFQELLEHYKKEEDKDEIFAGLGKCKKEIHTRLDRLVQLDQVLAPLKAELQKAKEDEDFAKAEKLSDDMKGPKAEVDKWTRELEKGLSFPRPPRPPHEFSELPDPFGDLVEGLVAKLKQDGCGDDMLRQTGFRR